MYVGSLPELHLMGYGWMLYNNIWALLAFVGLVMFPFTWTIATALFDAVKRHGFSSGDAPIAAFHSVFPSFILMMGIYGLACVPVVPLNVQAWEYTKLCTANGVPQPQAPTMTFGNTGTPADALAQLANGALQPGDARVPILWDVIMRIGAGVSRALNSGGACLTRSTFLDKELRKMTFGGDPGLQAELGQFVQDCYLPARGRFMRAMQNGTLTTVPTPASAVNPDQYFAARYRDWRGNPPPNQRTDEVFDRSHDPDYLGSRFYLETPGLYAPAIPGQYDQQVSTLKASKAIAGWPYDPIRDCPHYNAASGDFCTNAARNSDMANNRGSPTCDEWWGDDTLGLKNKLVNAIGGSATQYMQGWEALTIGEALNATIQQTDGEGRSDNWIIDKLIATTLANDTTTQESILEMPIDEEGGEITRLGAGGTGGMEVVIAGAMQLKNLGGKAAAATTAAFNVGSTLASHAVDFYTASWIVKNAYPIAQAYLLLFFIAMLPFMLVGSMYDIGRLLQIAMIFLAIQFLSPWRFVVEYLDERLFEIMFPDLWGFLGTDQVLKAPERILLEITTTAMYTIFPFILLWLVTLAGADAAAGAGKAFNVEKLADLSRGLTKGVAAGMGKKKP